jgi:transcriptional regulator with XRE-family HTH domain
MTGAELKRWRENNGWKQADLMIELEVASRQTISTWESTQEVPRMVELAIVALDQVEACRNRSGYEKQFTPEGIANLRASRLRGYRALEG